VCKRNWTANLARLETTQQSKVGRTPSDDCKQPIKVHIPSTTHPTTYYHQQPQTPTINHPHQQPAAIPQHQQPTIHQPPNLKPHQQTSNHKPQTTNHKTTKPQNSKTAKQQNSKTDQTILEKLKPGNPESQNLTTTTPKTPPPWLTD
jgi:hypothetical protein